MDLTPGLLGHLWPRGQLWDLRAEPVWQAEARCWSVAEVRVARVARRESRWWPPRSLHTDMQHLHLDPWLPIEQTLESGKSSSFRWLQNREAFVWYREETAGVLRR